MKLSNDREHRESVPFDQSYWVIPGAFLAGYYPGSDDREQANRKLRTLLDHGIRYIINLMEPHELEWYGNLFVPYEEQLRAIAEHLGIDVQIKRMPIRDASVPSRAHMINILNLIDQQVARRKPVYVHCLGGRGRTGTVVGCHLVRWRIASGEAALKMIQELRKNTANRQYPSPEFPEQFDMVLSWNEGE